VPRGSTGFAPGGAGVESVLPPVIGHRGAAACAPENTLGGLRQAKALDCLWVEFDVRLTADGQPVLLHDDRLERTTDGRGKVSARSFAAVRCHDAGSWFGPSFAGQRVPSLKEAVALLAELGLGANVELKAAHGREVETGTVVAEMLAKLWPCELPAPLISSFQPEALAAAQAGAPGIARGILFRAIPKDWRGIAERCGCETIHADHRRLYPALVADIRRAGYPVLAYTVNDPGRADILFHWGITAVFSDVPHRLHNAAAQGRSRRRIVVDPNSAGMPRQGSAW
jgi:glycerophosphoryl diester phosphodiesterase